MSIRLTREEFIDKAKLIHGDDKYEYNKVTYKNSRTKIKLVCPTHGEFEQTPKDHLKGHGCKYCGFVLKNQTLRKPIDEFFTEANKIHSNKYNYDYANYTNADSKIKIICPIHGEFSQIAKNHLKCGCAKCSGYFRDSISFIKDANIIHDNKYDYSKVNYTNSYTKVLIICPIHGEFEQTPSGHLSGRGCSKCRISKGENAVKKFLMENNLEFIPQHRFTECRNRIPLIFDFYLPNHNLCIEYQGSQHFNIIKYFGGLKRFKRQVKNDMIKENYCNSKNIKLLKIPYNKNVDETLKEFFKTHT
jgi:hypothetical protein